MGFNPARRIDQARRARHESEQVRRLRTRPHGHAEAKTFIVSGDITAGMYIPPVFVGVDPDDTIPEVKFAWEFGGMLRTGTADFTWLHGAGTSTAGITGSDGTFTTDPAAAITELPLPEVLKHRDYLQLVIVSASGAADLSGVIYMVTRQA